MRIAYFDGFSGAGGDMIVSSLLDAGADATRLRSALDSIGLKGYALTIEPVVRQGLAATRFHVELDSRSKQPHRRLEHIVEMLNRSPLSDGVKEKAVRVFQRLAEAEAKVHGCTVEKVHFHEVGAVDAILDIAGAMLALESLDVERVICSPLPTGSGTIVCEHGVMPVPAPATAELLKGAPLADCDEPGELVTPTAAAVLTTLADTFGPIPAMTLETLGYGAGTREGKRRPNLLRVLIGQADDRSDTDEIAVLETNIDDASPQMVGHCFDRLLGAGALDVYTMPIQMKKSRSGLVLTVLCEERDTAAMERILFAETTTFGIRRHRVSRVKMRRSHLPVETPFGKIRVKVGRRDDIETASPEYEDCRKAAGKYGVSLREVMAAAQVAWSAGQRG